MAEHRRQNRFGRHGRSTPAAGLTYLATGTQERLTIAVQDWRSVDPDDEVTSPPRFGVGRRPMRTTWMEALAERPREYLSAQWVGRQVLPVRLLCLRLAPADAHGDERPWPLRFSAIPAWSR